MSHIITADMVSAALQQLRAMHQIAPSEFGMRCALTAALDVAPKDTPADPETDAPIARLRFDDSAAAVEIVKTYGPGLPPGEHDVWCCPVAAPAPVAQSEFEVRADGKRVRVDRWEVAIRRIVALLWGNRHEFEVDEVVAAVRDLIPEPNDDDEGLVRAVLAAPDPVAQPSQCAQCKKAYRHGSAAGCPKCAPGVVVAESEFREPIAPAPVAQPVAWLHTSGVLRLDVDIQPISSEVAGSWSPLYTAAPAPVAQGEPVVQPARWYMVNKIGMATLCTDEYDARMEAANANEQYPLHRPHRAVQLVELAGQDVASRGAVGSNAT